MSETKEDVVLPIVEYGDDYDNDSFAEASDRESGENDSNSEHEKDEFETKKKNRGDDDVDGDGDGYRKRNTVTKPDHSDEEVISDDEQTKMKKKKVKKAFGVDLTPPEELLHDARKHSKVLSSKGKSREAVLELVRAVALARIIYGDGHWQLAQAYVDLAHGYLDILNYIPQAVGHAETAKQIMGASVHTAKNESDRTKILEVKMNTQYIHGRALAGQKKFVESEKCFLRCESIYRDWAKSSLVGRHHVDMEVKIAIALAKVSLMQEKFANASSQYEKALDILESNHGKASKDLIPIYQGLGKVELAKGNLGNSEQAISMFETAHTINSGLYKSGALPVAETGLALANAYSSIGGAGPEASAESYLNECITIYLTNHGPNHKSTIKAKDELVRLLLRTDRLDEGIKELKSTISAKEEVYGEFSEEVSDSHKLLANVQLAKSNMEAALKSYKNCINIETMLHGSANHRRVKDVQKSIDMLLANPKIAAKQTKSKQEEMKERPRFSSIVKGK